MFGEIPENITTIALDLGGILFEGLPENFTYKRIERDFRVKEHDLEDVLKPNYHSFKIGAIKEDEFWLPAVTKFNLDLVLLKEYYRQTVTIVPFVEKAISALCNRYSIYSLNNEPKEWMEYRIKHFKLDNYFDGYVTSGMIGIAKPNKEFFRYFLEHTKESAANILFVDDETSNIKTAQDLGFNTCLFNKIWPPLD